MKRMAGIAFGLVTTLAAGSAAARSVDVVARENRVGNQIEVIVGVEGTDPGGKNLKINGYTLDYDFDAQLLAFKSADQLVPFGVIGKLPFSSEFDCSASKKRCQAGNVPNFDADSIVDLFKLTFDILAPLHNDPARPWFTAGLLDPRFNDVTPGTGENAYAFGRTTVSAPAPVPEPGTALLTALGLAGLGVQRRRRVRKAWGGTGSTVGRGPGVEAYGAPRAGAEI